MRGRTRFRVMLAAVASLALVFSFETTFAAGTGTGAGDGGLATAAKKKKKKKCKKGFVLKKVKKKGKKKGKKKFKKKCVRKPRPLVRATISWTGGGGSSDMDLWVFDANGNRASPAANTIPKSTFSGNAAGPSGTETFTDNVFVKGKARPFSFGVCQEDGGSHNLTVTIRYVTADGVSHTDSQSYNDNGAQHTYPGGAPIPAAFISGCNFL